MNLQHLTWEQRFAIVQMVKPNATTVEISIVFGVPLLEAVRAVKNFKEGKLRPDLDMDTYPYKDIFGNIEIPAVHETKPAKPTRNKIVTAFMRIPVGIRTNAAEFCSENGISIHCLRQSKRFLEHVPEDIKRQIGTIIVRTNKDTKELLVWREL